MRYLWCGVKRLLSGELCRRRRHLYMPALVLVVLRHPNLFPAIITPCKESEQHCLDYSRSHPIYRTRVGLTYSAKTSSEHSCELKLGRSELGTAKDARKPVLAAVLALTARMIPVDVCCAL